jgi:hypothetical protein
MVTSLGWWPVKIDSTRNEHVLDIRSKILKDPMVNTVSSFDLD